MKTRIPWFMMALSLFAGNAGVSLGQEIEALRPQVRFVEDFERFEEGSAETGSEPVEERWQIDPAAGSVRSQIGEDRLPSKHLVISEGTFAWVSPWITVEHLRLTRVMLNFTALSNFESGSNRDFLDIYAVTRQEDRSLGRLFLLRVADESVPGSVFQLDPATQLSPGKETLRLESLLGQLSEAAGTTADGPTEIQLIVKARTTSGSIFAIDDLKVTEEPFDGMLKQVPRLNVTVPWVVADLAGFPSPAESNPALPYLDFSVRYRHYGWSLPNESGPLLDPDSFGDDDLSLGETDDVRFELLSVEDDTHFHVDYRMHRPAAGWESLPTRPILNTRDGAILAVDDTPFRESYISFIDIRPPNTVVSLSSALEPISQDDRFVNLPVRLTAHQPISLESLGDDDMFVSFGSGESLFATLQEVRTIQEDGKEVTAVYRLNRPTFGWPLIKGPTGGPSPYALKLRLAMDAISPDFTQGGYTGVLTEEGDDLFIPVAEVPHIRMSLPEVTQTLSMTDDQFEIDFIYTSESPILLDSIGDGDVALYTSGQAGRLVRTTPSADGLEVTARFAFDRDLVATLHLLGGGLFGGGGPGLSIPLGTVFDEDGGTNLTQISYGRGHLWYLYPNNEVTATFLPKSQFHKGTRSYRFAVRYRSDRAPIRMEDFEQTHLLFSNTIDVSVDTIASKEDGYWVDVSYVATPKEGEWLESAHISLHDAAIRNLRGGSHRRMTLVTLGAVSFEEGPLDTSGIELVGGHLIENDPETHQVAFITSSDIYQFDQAVLLFGGRSSMFAEFEESEEDFPSLVGRLLTVNNGVATFELDRPEIGWGAWQANRLPYSLHLGTGDSSNGGFITAGHVTVYSPENPLPLLFSFEEWVRRLEKQADLPDGSLEGDADGDGVDSVLEYAMGSDLTDTQDQGHLTPKKVMKAGKPHLQLTFPVRTNSIGLQAEIQHSVDGEEWRSVDEEFEVLEREEIAPDVESLTLCSKEPLAEGQALGLFRIAVKR